MWNNSRSKEVSSSSPSKSSSTCSSPSPFSPSSPIQTAPPPKNSMEELWKDINLSSLQRHHTAAAAATSASGQAFHAIILQDFLACPFDKDPPRKEGSHEPSGGGGGGGGGAAVLVSGAPPPATSLTLNSGPEFHYLENTDHNMSNPPQLQSHSVFPSFCKKRNQGNEDDSSDRRHKRMIKNRESAARSRARKQAYTNELENEIAHLVEENAKLRRQLEKSCVAAPAQLPKKHTLHRTLTAPF